jgi:Xaa-Pro aminopeptidase
MSRTRIAVSVLFLCTLTAVAADSGIWKVTPPPPVSWDRDRLSDLSARRKAVAEQLGPKSVLILYAAESRNYAADVDWPYRQENNFFYLTGINQEGSAFVMIPGAEKVREILFLPPSNPAQESWTGHILTPAEGRKISGIQEVWDARRLNEFLQNLLPPAQSVFVDPPAAGHGAHGAPPPSAPPALPVDPASAFRGTIDLAAKNEVEIYMMSNGRAAEYGREIEITKKLSALTPSITVKDAGPIFGTLRRVKSQREIDLLQHAVYITHEAFQRVYALAVPGTPEYEIQAQFEFTFLRRNGHWGYPCIVASGVNATTLHYETNKDTMKAGDLLLIDDAAEFDGYSVDVTRTIPVSGKYSKEQAEIYRLVWQAQQAAFQQALPGHTTTGGPDSVQGAAIEVFKQGLFKLGLITDATSEPQVKIWFNHGISHGIGLNVHDPGGRELQPGMMVTVEPGLYFRPDALENLPKTPENEKFIAAVRPAFEKYKGIGVRIEDDILITNGQPKIVSGAIPSKLEEVEAAIAQLRKAIRNNPLP